MAPQRVFIKEGQLVKVCRRTSKKRYFFLFNDIIIYGAMSPGGYVVHRVIPLDNLRADDVADTDKYSHAFSVLELFFFPVIVSDRLCPKVFHCFCRK